MSARSEEAFSDASDRAMALDPLCPGMWLHFSGAGGPFNWADTKRPAALLKRRIVRNPDTDASRVLLAASYGQMGRIEEASRWSGRRYSASTRLFIGNTVARCCRTKIPDEFRMRLWTVLRKAGLVA